MGTVNDARCPARSTITREPSVPAASRATMRTSAAAERPNVTRAPPRVGVARARTAGSSALATRVPSARTPSNRAPFSRATSSMVPPTPRVWARPTLTTTPTSGDAIDARAAISPRRLIPISSTAYLCAGSSWSTTAGKPMRLFKLPAVAWHAATEPRSAAQISFVVVLPALPVMPTTRLPGPASRQTRKCSAAMAPQACSVSSTSTASIPASAGARPRWTTTRMAPASIAGARKSWPSCFSPASATKAPPGTTARLSVVIPTAVRAPAERTTAPPVTRAAVAASSAARFDPIGVATA